MKQVSTTSTSASRSKVRPHAGRQSPYLSATSTKALLSSSLAARTERLNADDMVNTDEAAALAGTTRMTINTWIAKGRAIGLTQTRRGFKLPKWQFEPVFWDSIPKLGAVLGTGDGWTMLTFLESALGGLDGLTPRQAIEQGKLARVLKLAGAEGH